MCMRVPVRSAKVCLRVSARQSERRGDALRVTFRVTRDADGLDAARVQRAGLEHAAHAAELASRLLDVAADEQVPCTLAARRSASTASSCASARRRRAPMCGQALRPDLLHARRPCARPRRWMPWACARRHDRPRQPSSSRSFGSSGSSWTVISVDACADEVGQQRFQRGGIRGAGVLIAARSCRGDG